VARRGLTQPDPPGLYAKQRRHATQCLAGGALLGRRAVEGFRDFLQDAERSRLGKATAIFQGQRLFFDRARFLAFTGFFFDADFFLVAGLFLRTGLEAAARRALLALRGLLAFAAGFAGFAE
jgi:hypothetical protein